MMGKFWQMKGVVSRFQSDRSGGVAIMAGFMFVTLVVAIGGALDYSSTIANTKKAQRMMDSTVLALTRQDLNTIDVQEAGEALFESLVSKASLDSATDNVEFVLSDNVVRGTAVIGSTTNFLSLIGMDRIRARVEAAAVPPAGVPLEIALVLDTSGSMATDLNGKPRIERLKDAVNLMFDSLEDTLPRNATMLASVVPYSTSVNVGNFPQALAAQSVGLGPRPPVGADVWAAERVSAVNGLDYTVSAASPSVDPVPFVTAAEIGDVSPSSRMSALTRDIDAARASIDDMTAEGWTAGHIGMAWGVYALANEWQAIWPEAPAPTGQAKKVIVMLSDGEFNTTHNIGDTSLAIDPNSLDGALPFKNNNALESDAYFKDICDLADARGITVYTVALALDPVSETKLAACAANGGRLFKADSAADLREAFDNIARELGLHRLVG